MENSLYIQMHSIHGLVRSENMELGRDADTGGQVKYVIELGKHLSRLDEIRRVDLFTRLISDKTVSEDYARQIEPVDDKFRIVRIQCGGRKYMRKELLWPHLDEYIDKTIKFIKRAGHIPDVIHGHYADAGYVGMHLSKIFGLPFIFTGHSLGRAKRQKLLNEGMKESEVIKKYKIDHRIGAEEEVLKNADLVITSTHQEIEMQYGMYQHKTLPKFRVIPPGLDIEKFYPFSHDTLMGKEKDEIAIFSRASVIEELNRFFTHPDRPVILALCRPDKRKNISGLVEAYGKDLELRAMANLAVFAGIRKDISSMEENERDVLTQMLLLMDKHDLYGKMAIPKKHDFENEVPELYRIAAERKGVFVNVALTEPFGLTLLEASATGLPIVATNDGGPRDIMRNCENGVLVDPTDAEGTASAIKQIISDHSQWDRYSKNGILRVHKHYTWESHAEKYISEAKALVAETRTEALNVAVPKDAIGRRLAKLDYFLITDIDNTLIGGEPKDLASFLKLWDEHREYIGFGVATGRSIDSAAAYLKQHGVDKPDVIISSVGTEIYYGEKLHYGQGWETHIKHKWDREKIRRLLDEFPFLKYQEESAQRPHKISYTMPPAKDRIALIHDLLLKHKCRYTLVYSQDEFLDILPYRASKGKAVRYLSYKWEIPLGHFLVCGDSGNDEEMLRGEPLAVVVGNYSKELEKLRGVKRIYFAEKDHAAGIMEGMLHYQFFESARGNK